MLLRSAKPRVFCAGANIRMLAGATHAHKVNFCKFTNETRNGIEDASETSGLATICVINGTAAGGGYELALAADHIMLVDDGSSAVSLPELPLLAGAARHRRAHARHRQAQGAPRPRRRVLHHRGRHQRQARGRLAAGRRSGAGLEARGGGGERAPRNSRRRSQRRSGRQRHRTRRRSSASVPQIASNTARSSVEFERAARLATVTVRGPRRAAAGIGRRHGGAGRGILAAAACARARRRDPRHPRQRIRRRRDRVQVVRRSGAGSRLRQIPRRQRGSLAGARDQGACGSACSSASISPRARWSP